MNNGIDLANAPGEALLDAIARQQAVIGQLQRRIESLVGKGRAKPDGPRGCPGSSPSPTSDRP